MNFTIFMLKKYTCIDIIFQIFYNDKNMKITTIYFEKINFLKKLNFVENTENSKVCNKVKN